MTPTQSDRMIIPARRSVTAVSVLGTGGDANAPIGNACAAKRGRRLVHRRGICARAGPTSARTRSEHLRAVRCFSILLASGAIMAGGSALASTPTPPPRTISLGWVERHSAYGRHFVMVFEVQSVTIERRRWTAKVAFVNDTNLYVRVEPRFALVARTSTGKRVVLRATRFRPAVPSELDFGQRWVGTIGGNGTPPHGSRVRLRLGDFRVRMAPNLMIVHLTRHSFSW
jgi:hypothetical protein